MEIQFDERWPALERLFFGGAGAGFGLYIAYLGLTFPDPAMPLLVTMVTTTSVIICGLLLAYAGAAWATTVVTDWLLRPARAELCKDVMFITGMLIALAAFATGAVSNLRAGYANPGLFFLVPALVVLAHSCVLLLAVWRGSRRS